MEKKGGEIACRPLVLRRHDLVWPDGFLPRQVSPIPYSKQPRDSDTQTEK